jgi:hypothetical protein
LTESEQGNNVDNRINLHFCKAHLFWNRDLKRFGRLEFKPFVQLIPVSREDFVHNQSRFYCSKSNQLHIVIFRFFFTNLRVIL